LPPALALPGIGAGAHAAEPLVASGKQMVLATYYEIDALHCRALAAPRVRITGKAVLGKAIVVRSQGQSSASSICPGRQVPIAQVLYQADKPGVDALTWEVRYVRRRPDLERVSIQVTVGPRKP